MIAHQGGFDLEKEQNICAVRRGKSLRGTLRPLEALSRPWLTSVVRSARIRH